MPHVGDGAWMISLDDLAQKSLDFRYAVDYIGRAQQSSSPEPAL